ncbi:MAG TPA: alpha/beta fold hydrolase [Streptosporangiaceae bacterium]
MTDLFALVPAPVLGPASWQPVAAALAAAGRRAMVPSLAGFDAGGPPYAAALVERGAEQVARAARGTGRVVLVVHSGAGAFAWALADAIGAAEVAVVFADAGLPELAGSTPVVDDAFLPHLRRIAVDGIVPPWPQWFPDAGPAELFPTEAARAAVEADARPLPLAFFEERVRAGRQPAGGAGYLLFSPGYEPAAARAMQRGWPAQRLPGTHLHPLVAPAAVASALTGLAAACR